MRVRINKISKREMGDLKEKTAEEVVYSSCQDSEEGFTILAFSSWS